jgi:hypothetical protein
MVIPNQTVIPNASEESPVFGTTQICALPSTCKRIYQAVIIAKLSIQPSARQLQLPPLGKRGGFMIQLQIVLLIGIALSSAAAMASERMKVKNCELNKEGDEEEIYCKVSSNAGLGE